MGLDRTSHAVLRSPSVSEDGGHEHGPSVELSNYNDESLTDLADYFDDEVGGDHDGELDPEEISDDEP
jgi:hypothetical protein